jgi:transposase
MNGMMYVLSTGCQWRAIPKDLPPRSTLFGYLDYHAAPHLGLGQLLWDAAPHQHKSTALGAAVSSQPA